MGAFASLSSTTVQVTPGEQVSLEVRVRNTGSVVDQFTVTVVGEAAAWAHVEPESQSLFPGAEGVAVVRLAPPRLSGTTAGPVTFGVKVASKEDPDGSVVEEATVEVGAFSDLFGELTPRTSRGRRSAVHDVALDNRGNTRVSAVLTGVDPDNHLGFAFSPPALAADPGTAVFSRLRVVPRKRFLRGPAQTRPFQVVVEADDRPPMPIDGVLVQEPLVPRGLVRALVMAALLLLLLAGTWFAFLQPEIESAAQDAVADELASPENRPAIAPGGGGASGSGAGAGATTTVPPGAGTAAGGTPIDGRLFVNASGETAYEVPGGRTLQLTDIVLQNPGGNTGTLRIQRDGTALLVVALENFRDLDYHFVTPVVFTPGQKLQLVATCTSAACTPGAYFAGTLIDS